MREKEIIYVTLHEGCKLQGSIQLNFSNGLANAKSTINIKVYSPNMYAIRTDKTLKNLVII